MIFQPAILALLLVAALGVAALAAAAPGAWQIARHWDLNSGSARQIRLERRTTLLTTLVALVLALQMAALLLFVFNADRMAEQFVGAMCAVGSLRANEWGFAALYAQMALFFAAALWLVVHRADHAAPDAPLTRVKFAALLGLLPLAALSAALQWSYFRNLRADIITSCCGSLFSADAATLGGDLAALAPAPALAAFVATLLAAIAAAAWHWRSGRGAALTGLLSAAAFAVALAGIVAFVSLYIYEHPHHHCPFCILKPEYGYLGYALYVPLFGATAAGMGVGVLGLLRQRAGLGGVIRALSARLALAAAGGFGLFLVLSLWLMWRSPLVLLGPP